MKSKLTKPENKFHFDESPANFNDKERSVSDFWQWAYSDLYQNVTRGMVGQYIVAWILGVDDIPDDAWGSYDLLSKEGKKIEVKTTSYLQAWEQKNEPNPKFRIKKTSFYSKDSGYSKEKDFQADIYVLCYFFEEDKEKVNITNLNQWKFWVLPKKIVERIFSEKESISVSEISSEFLSVSAKELYSEIQKCS